MEKAKDLFEKIEISLLNNTYVYGGIIFGIMIVIYFVYAFNDMKNFEKRLNDKFKLKDNWLFSHNESLLSVDNLRQLIIVISVVFDEFGT